jgi:hypothetical protein
MPVHVEEMTSEVTAESGASAAATGGGMQWEERARVREMQTQLMRDALRTSAEAYDD